MAAIVNPPPIEALRGLRTQVAGPVFMAEDAGYDEARRVWNGMIDRRPAAIVRAATVADIGPVIEAARRLRLPLAIRGGGHNVAGNGTVDGGIVLDLSALSRVEVDPKARTVRVEAGATLADIDRATEPHALAVPIGVVSGTGIAGLTLGGGFGWLTRAYGLSVDNLIQAEVVTANGELVRTSATEHPELFWGIRGGGGNFGVVTSFTFRAYPLGPRILAGTFIYPKPRWTAALRAYRDWTAGLPDALTSIVTFMVPPPDWELGNEALMFIGFAWASPNVAEGQAVVERLRQAARPDVEVLDPVRWPDWQAAFDAILPKGVRAYWKNASFDRLDDSMIDAIADQAGRLTWFGTAADVHHMEGAFGHVPEDATAFPNRTARYWLNIYGYWGDPADDADRIAWVRGFAGAMAPHAMAGQYINFMGAGDGRDDRQKALAAYGREKLDRLVRVKQRYDPENLFRINHNIPPGVKAGG